MIWYSSLLLLNIAASLRICLHVQRQRDMPGRIPTIIAMWAMIVWASSILVQLFSSTMPVLYGGIVVASLARTTFGTMVLCALLSYTGASQGRYSRLSSQLLQGASLTMLGVLVFQLATNPSLHLWSSGSMVASSGDLTLLLMTPGYGRLFFERAGYVVAVIGCFQALLAPLRSVGAQRRAVRPLVIGVGGVLTMLLGLRLAYGDLLFSIAYYVDIAVISFGVVVISRGIDVYEPFAIAPFIQRLTINQLEDGLLVFDAQGRLIEVNAAAARIFGWSRNDLRRLNVIVLHKVIVDALFDRRALPVDLELGDGDAQHIYEIRRNEMLRGSEALGVMLHLHDVTENRYLLRSLRRLAIEDGLTGAVNRRYFLEQLHQEAGSALGVPFTLLLFDVDHFKAVNDTYGHTVGDEVLVALVSRVWSTLRAGDLLCRYGGEEFIVLARNIGQEAASQLAERLRGEVCASPIITLGGEVVVTISVGMTVWYGPGAPDIDGLIQDADRALYAAKEAGRNCVRGAWEGRPCTQQLSKHAEGSTPCDA